MSLEDMTFLFFFWDLVNWCFRFCFFRVFERDGFIDALGLRLSFFPLHLLLHYIVEYMIEPIYWTWTAFSIFSTRADWT